MIIKKAARFRGQLKFYDYQYGLKIYLLTVSAFEVTPEAFSTLTIYTPVV